MEQVWPSVSTALVMTPTHARGLCPGGDMREGGRAPRICGSGERVLRKRPSPPLEEPPSLPDSVCGHHDGDGDSNGDGYSSGDGSEVAARLAMQKMMLEKNKKMKKTAMA